MTASESMSIPDDLDALRTSLVEWYERDHRDFPWRRTTDPYEILVSEVMSHQTQLSRVVDSWDAFLERWPTVEALAAADRASVIGFWSSHSLGYNSRAIYLHEAAQYVVESCNGTIPRTPEELTDLKGVGPYTANAVASFAFNNGNAVIDTNVKRVLYRAFNVPDDENRFEAVANTLLPDDHSRKWNNAIMELGAVACRPTVRCEEASCPWRHWCHAYGTNDFSAPNVPTQTAYEGSRRQFRGRIIAALDTHHSLTFDELGSRIRVDYTRNGSYGREWLQEILDDLRHDGLVETVDPQDEDGERSVRLKR